MIRLPANLCLLISLLLLLFLAACGGPTYQVRVLDTPSRPDLKPTQKPYEVNGTRYDPIPSAEGFVEEGIASWYGKDFHGRKTSNGEIYDMHGLTAAHKTLPMNVHLKVTNLDNGRTAVVRVNDRGPFVKSRIIDLSYAAASQLGVVGPGTAPVRVEALGYREGGGNDVEPHYRQPVSYDAGSFMVQVGAFTIRENAYRLADKLRDQYGQAAVAEGWVNGQKFYRVRVGLYASLVLAGDALRDIERSGYANSFIVAQ